MSQQRVAEYKRTKVLMKQFMGFVQAKDWTQACALLSTRAQARLGAHGGCERFFAELDSSSSNGITGAYFSRETGVAKSGFHGFLTSESERFDLLIEKQGDDLRLDVRPVKASRTTS